MSKTIQGTSAHPATEAARAQPAVHPPAHATAPGHRPTAHRAQRPPPDDGFSRASSGGSPVALPGAASSGPQPDVHVPTRFVYQMSLPQPKVACFRAASMMAEHAGGQVTGPEQGMWLNSAPFGRQTDPRVARRYIDGQLNAGRPVVVGVSHPGGKHANADHATDHWLTITGRGTDGEGRTYYTFQDPGTRVGQDTNPRNRLYVDDQSGRLFRPSAESAGHPISALRFDLTAVRPNAR